MKSNSVDYVRDIRLHIGPAPKGLKPRVTLGVEQRYRYTDQLKDCGWLYENLFEFSTEKVYSEFTVWASELIQESIRIQTKNDKRMPVHFLIRGEPSIGKTTDIVAEISAAAQEQAQGIKEINSAMNQMDSATQSNAANAEESASAAAELANQAEQMNTMTSQLKTLIGASTFDPATKVCSPLRALKNISIASP